MREKDLLERLEAMSVRLAAYEDTGLEPEDFKKAFNEEAILKLAEQVLGTTPDCLRELVKAQDEGRVLMLPCKVGDVVYAFGYKYIEQLTILTCGNLGCVAEDEKGKFRYLSYGDFNKTVFLTRAEAEAALSAQKGDTHETDPV